MGAAAIIALIILLIWFIRRRKRSRSQRQRQRRGDGTVEYPFNNRSSMSLILPPSAPSLLYSVRGEWIAYCKADRSSCIDHPLIHLNQDTSFSHSHHTHPCIYRLDLSIKTVGVKDVERSPVHKLSTPSAMSHPRQAHPSSLPPNQFCSIPQS